MNDAVGFIAGPATMVLRPELAELRKLLDAAHIDGKDALNDWENNFVDSCRFNLHKFRNKFVITPERQEVFTRIETKLRKEGLWD